MKVPGWALAGMLVVCLGLIAYLIGVGGVRKTWEFHAEVHEVQTSPAAASSAVEAEEPEDEDGPDLKRPTVVSGGEEDQDSVSIDEKVGLRTFKVKLQSFSPGEDPEQLVTAAYVDQLPANDLSWRITYVADQWVGYDDEFSQELPSGRDGLHLRFHVGNFSQDNCGDVTTLFSAQTSTVFMVSFSGHALADQLLEGAGCEQVPKSGPLAIDFCEKRAACIAKHLTGKLDPQLANHPAARALRQLVLQ